MVAAVFAATVLFLVHAIAERVEKAAGSLRLGGAEFWSKIDREIARAADPSADLPPEQRERLIRNLRVIVERWGPFVDVVTSELQEPAPREESQAATASRTR